LSMDTKNPRDFYAEREINQQRRDERFQDIGCKIFDFIAQFCVEHPQLDLTAKREGVRLAIEKFRDILPEGMIYNLACRQYDVEEARNKAYAAAPKPVRKDIYGRPIIEHKNTVDSPRKP